ncbi:hypothetical protein HYS50_03695 [Candidatus Woesearchaeota archaeon]|nr:hypothetical protein [Candidatus Woesearchaeota archaeon]
MAKQTFQYETNSNAAPFVSDTGRGFIEAADPMVALEDVVKTYDHPAGLFAAVIRAPTPENPILARYLSARAATQEAAPCGLTQWKQDGLYVNDKKVSERKERYELV